MHYGKRFAIPALLAAIIACSCGTPAFATPVSGDAGALLMDFFAKKFTPDEMVMVLDEPPDPSGSVRDMYLDIKGCSIGGVRVASLKVRGMGVELTPVSEWTKGNVDVKRMLHAVADCRITADDINRNLLGKDFGDDDHWHGIQLSIGKDGVYARGYYQVRVLFTLDVLIEITSRFRIVDAQQIWLSDYTLAVNRVGVPDFITDKAVSQIQPILALSTFVFPLRLHAIEYEAGAVRIRSRVLPEPIQGVTYTYKKAAVTPQ